jgi:hypothetical protein
VGSNFECLGFNISDPGDLERTIAPLIESAPRLHKSGGGFSHHLWRDGSGAGIVFHIRKGALHCLTPWFSPPEGTEPWRVVSEKPMLDPECVDCSGAACDVLDEKGDLSTRAAVQFACFRPYQAWLSKRRTYALNVSAFASELDVFATQADFDKVASRIPVEGPDGIQPTFATNFFIPTGLFDEDLGPRVELRARALFGGEVSGAFLRTNRASGKKFWHLQVESLPGRIDVVHPEREGLYPATGQIALVSAWLVGRPLQPPPRGILGRLLGR